MRRALLVLCVLLAPAFASAAPPAETRDQIICRAKSGVGFSYWWGGACWCNSGCSPNFGCSKGGCSGNCPSCNHWGGHGADCSGFTNKVWQVPSAMSLNGSCAHGGYVAKSYTSSATHWDKISRSNMLKADALASSTHVMVYESGDPWGSLWAYEAKGCSYGIKHNIRTCSSAYSAARRHNIINGECSPGQTQSKGCGNCGTQKRSCKSNGTWDGWSGCGGQGPCSPGQTESAGCGNCGKKSRSCNGSCNWGGWGGCSGEGPCAPGQAQTEKCGDCGEHSRSCGGSCQWDGWDGCEGPDPGDGKLQCDTGELGVCADGIQRCVQGWKTCVRTTDPSDELCDDLDNDCDGPVDEDRPAAMGSPPAAYAAELTDLSYPPALAPGSLGKAWAEFRNVGGATWKKGTIWLSAAGGPDGGVSELYSPGQWPAWDVAAVLQDDVAPGESARLEFPLRMPLTGGTTPGAKMTLLGPDGTGIRCPQPELSVAVKAVPGMELGAPATAPAVEVQAAEEPAAGEEAPVTLTEAATDHTPSATPGTQPSAEKAGAAESGCAAARSTTSGGGPIAALAVALLAVWGWRRRAAHPGVSR